MIEQSATTNSVAQFGQTYKLRCLTCGHIGEVGQEIGEFYYHGLHHEPEPYCWDIDACEARRRLVRRAVQA